MAAVSPSVPPHAGCAMVVGSAAQREGVVEAVEAMGMSPGEADDPYAAMSELCRNPDSYDAIVLSLHGLFREELVIIPAIKQRFPRIEVWLADLDGRPAMLAEAMRLGVDGLLGEEGLHRLNPPAAATPSATATIVPTTPAVTVPPVQAPTRDIEQTEEPAPVVRTARPAATTRNNGRDPGESSGNLASPAPVRKSAAKPRDRSTAAPTRDLKDSADAKETNGQAANGQHQRSREAARKAAEPPAEPPPESQSFGSTPDEPLLTADELRALLHDQPEGS